MILVLVGPNKKCPAPPAKVRRGGYSVRRARPQSGEADRRSRVVLARPLRTGLSAIPGWNDCYRCDMGRTPLVQFTDHLTITHSTTIQGQVQDGITIEGGVRVEIDGQVVGPIVLREGSRLTISGQALGPLQIDVGAELTLVGVYAGTLPQSFDGALLASQGAIINQKALLDGRFEELQYGVQVGVDTARLFRLTRSDGSLAIEEFEIQVSRPTLM